MQKIRNGFIWMALLTLVMTNTACTSMRSPVSSPQELTPELIHAAVEPGDTVLIHSHDGSKLRMEITSVTPDSLIGFNREGEHTLAMDDIAELKVREFSKGKSAAVVGSLTGFWVLLAVIMASMPVMI